MTLGLRTAAMSLENLFTPSAIKLFGREFKGLSVNQPLQDGQPPLEERARIPAEKVQQALQAKQGYRQNAGRLERALRKVAFDAADDNHARFARIYGFAYEGQYYELPRPILFLVYGPGKPAEENRFTVQNVGLAAKDWTFASDIMMWEFDDKDVSMCLDIESGPMKEILLNPVFEMEEELSLSGAAASRGAAVQRGAAAVRGAAAGRGAAVARGAAISRDGHRSK
jgi:hypothetical protein